MGRLHSEDARAKITDPRHLLRLLRARGLRPRRHCSANQRDKLAPSHAVPRRTRLKSTLSLALRDVVVERQMALTGLRIRARCPRRVDRVGLTMSELCPLSP